MSGASSIADGVLHHRFVVPPDAVDRNGHVNNVVYIQWMQDVAIRHSDAVGGTQAIREEGCLWVVRSHRITYLSPAFAGDGIEASTWVVDFQRVKSRRRYRFFRTSDERLLAEGETEWVCVDAQSGRPRTVPDRVRACFTPRPDPGA